MRINLSSSTIIIITVIMMLSASSCCSASIRSTTVFCARKSNKLSLPSRSFDRWNSCPSFVTTPSPTKLFSPKNVDLYGLSGSRKRFFLNSNHKNDYISKCGNNSRTASTCSQLYAQSTTLQNDNNMQSKPNIRLASKSNETPHNNPSPETTAINVKVYAKIIPEPQWRKEVDNHAQKIQSLLAPGLFPPSSSSQQLAGNTPNINQDSANKKNALNKKKQQRTNQQPKQNQGQITGLDPKHPIYNFLIEYYGLKGSKGVRRLMRWCPPPFFHFSSNYDSDDSVVAVEVPLEITSGSIMEKQTNDIPAVSGVILENANLDDVTNGALHLRGATFLTNTEYEKIASSREDFTMGGDEGISGVLYSPSLYLAAKDADVLLSGEEQNQHPLKAAAAFLWYRTLLRNTLRSEPILYCHGMHEWAMMYQPPGAPPPPSSQYQSHLPLRISQQTINEQVERKGVRCTHIDALRFFSPTARKWNHFGRLDEASSDEIQLEQTMAKCDADCKPPETSSTILSRNDQLNLEQKACLHANMDLFKIALRLQPFISSELLMDALTVALQARTLDVEASPYDVSGYEGLDWKDVGDAGLRVASGIRQLGAVQVETEEGRKLYQKQQMEVMRGGDIVRRMLLREYNQFLENVFDIREEIDIDEAS